MATIRDSATLHVFYGVACTGKSTLAMRFAYEHSIRTIIHTDYVREVQRAWTRPSEGSPLLKVSHNAWELFGEPSAEHIVKGFLTHVDAVTPSLLALARKLALDGLDAIMEGVHCYSGVLDQLRQVPCLCVHPRLLVASSEQHLADHIQHKQEARSRCAEAKMWQNHLKTLMHIQGFLQEDAREHHIPIICTE